MGFLGQRLPLACCSQRKRIHRGCQQIAESQLFRGISFYLNGQTGEVSALRLTKLIQRFGGATTPFPSSSTSYMIGTALASGKMQRYLASKSWRSSAQPAMLRPEWIHDCIAAGALVPATKYLVVKDTTMRQIDSYVQIPAVGTSLVTEVAGASVVSAAASTAAVDPLAVMDPAPPAAPRLQADQSHRTPPESREAAVVAAADDAAPSRAAHLHNKLEIYRAKVQLQVSRRLERFDNDDDFRFRVLTQHADRQSYSGSVVRRYYVYRGPASSPM